MRRWVATVFLLLIAFYVGASHCDRCSETPGEEGQVCHLMCSDGCATAPIPMAPTPPPPDPLPKAVYEETVDCPILNLDLEPEKTPPRS